MRWTKRIDDPNIGRIYLATLTLGLAYGMAISLVPLLLNDKGFDKRSIGTLAAWFASGIVALSLPMGGLIKRFTAKATLTAALDKPWVIPNASKEPPPYPRAIAMA